MKPASDRAAAYTAAEAFGFAFKWWLFIFINIWVPLDLIYRSGTLINALSTVQFIKNFSSIVIFCSLLALAIAVISLILGGLINHLIHIEARWVDKSNIILGLLIILSIIMDYLWRWIKAVFKISSLPIGPTSYNLRILFYCVLLIILIAGMALIWRLFKEKIYIEVKTLSKSLFKINSIIIVICLLFGIGDSLYNNIDHSGNDVAMSVGKQKASNTPHNIIIVTFDALNASHESLYGYHYRTTPNLEKLGRESYVFNNMYANSNWTLPGLASLLTGEYPTKTRLNEQISYCSGGARSRNLAFLLKKLGYETAVVWGNEFACPFINNFKGFDYVEPGDTWGEILYQSGWGPTGWLDFMTTESLVYRVGMLFYTKIAHPAVVKPFKKPEFSFAKAEKLLGSLKEPFFLWIHIWPPHRPYLAGDGFLYSILKEKVFDKPEYLGLPVPFPYPPKCQPEVDKIALRYDENICYADHEFGKFLSFLREKGLLNNSFLFVSSDHGEMFSRGFITHGGPYLFQALVHVPLIIHLPGQRQGHRIEANVSQADIAPTVLDLLGLRAPKWMEGKSFKPVLADGNLDTGTKFSMNLGYVNCPDSLKSRSVAAIKGNYKLIKYLDWKRYEMYNLKDDPQERTNLVDSQPQIFSSLKQEIGRLLATY